MTTVRRVLVAGTAGGVGTTTVTALLFRSWSGNAGAPRLADHTAGSLSARLTDGDEVGRIDDGTLLVDAGPLAWALVHGAERADPLVSFVLVTAATPVGCDLASRCLRQLRTPDALSRTVLVYAEVFGRHRIDRQVAALTADHPELRGAVRLPADPALAAGGSIPAARLTRRTRQAVDELAAFVTARTDRAAG